MTDQSVWIVADSRGNFVAFANETAARTHINTLNEHGIEWEANLFPLLDQAPTLTAVHVMRVDRLEGEHGPTWGPWLEWKELVADAPTGVVVDTGPPTGPADLAPAWIECAGTNLLEVTNRLCDVMAGGF
jgi:hypothetical protein